jgi:hypothetical protein
MAVRIVALLIPLAITLPQLQTNRPSAAPTEPPVAQAQPTNPPEWSYDTQHGTNAALTRVVLDSPVADAMRTIGSAGGDAADVASVQPAARKAPSPHAAAKRVRLASSAKAATTASASTRHATRHEQAAPPDAGCEPFAHCAPVVVGKVTPVNRKSL